MATIVNLAKNLDQHEPGQMILETGLQMEKTTRFERFIFQKMKREKGHEEKSDP